MIFDTHAHYNSSQFDEDREELLASMAGHNVGTIINVGASLEDCRNTLALAEKYDFIYAAIGVHPDEVGELNEEQIGWLRREASGRKKVVAIGEIGLDYHWDVEPREVQKAWFIRQLDLARELSLPVIIHSRDAAQDTFDIMKEHGAGLGGSIHCYSGSPEMALEYVKLGYHIGIGGVLTFKNGRRLKETAAVVPLERILLETDCPYMAPVPFRGKRNNSIYIDYVAQTLAEIKGISKEEVIAVTEQNAREVFGI